MLCDICNIHDHVLVFHYFINLKCECDLQLMYSKERALIHMYNTYINCLYSCLIYYSTCCNFVFLACFYARVYSSNFSDTRQQIGGSWRTILLARFTTYDYTFCTLKFHENMVSIKRVLSNFLNFNFCLQNVWKNFQQLIDPGQIL